MTALDRQDGDWCVRDCMWIPSILNDPQLTFAQPPRLFIFSWLNGQTQDINLQSVALKTHMLKFLCPMWSAGKRSAARSAAGKCLTGSYQPREQRCILGRTADDRVRVELLGVSPQGAVDGSQFLGLFTLAHVGYGVGRLGVLQRERGGRHKSVKGPVHPSIRKLNTVNLKLVLMWVEFGKV